MNNNERLIVKYRKQILCIFAGFILFAFAKMFLSSGGSEDAAYLTREGYGDTESINEIYVSGLLDEEVALEIPVKARTFSDDEIFDAMDRCMDEVIERIRTRSDGAGNSGAGAEDAAHSIDLQAVRGDLYLETDMTDYGFTIHWKSSDTHIVNRRGKVYNEELEKPVDVKLTATVIDNANPERTAEYLIPIRVMPPLLTEDESLVRDYMKEIDAQDNATRNKEGMRLPEAFAGRLLEYRKDNGTNYNVLWILGIVAALLLYLKDMQDKKKDDEKRRKQMLLDYPEIVSKLMVFIGAGMSIRQTWDKICTDYEERVKPWYANHAEQEKSKRRKHRKCEEPRYAYEEMCVANNRLKTGANEDRVFRDFGRACKSKQYMKLASLLEQNRKSGVAGLKSILSLEMVEAWEERKNAARRAGEEAGTKLLIPLVMMLGVVLVIVMIPAMMKM